MENLEIIANIRKEKLNEFNQSKLTFLEGLVHIDGYNGYTEIPGSNFKICIQWEQRAKLEIFLNSDLYKFFHGAIMTLGKMDEIIIKSEK